MNRYHLEDCTRISVSTEHDRYYGQISGHKSKPGLRTDKRNEALDNYRHSTKAKSIDYLMSRVRCDVKQYFSGGAK